MIITDSNQITTLATEIEFSHWIWTWQNKINNSVPNLLGLIPRNLLLFHQFFSKNTLQSRKQFTKRKLIKGLKSIMSMMMA